MKFWKQDIAIDPTPVLIGLLQGLGFYALSHLTQQAAPLREAIHLFLIIAPIGLMLVIRPAGRLRDLGVVLGIAFLFAVLQALQPITTGWSHFTFGALLASFSLLCFYQTVRDKDWQHVHYPFLYHNAWTNLLILVMAGIFTGAVALVLYIWGALFNLIGLTLFDRLFSEDLFAWPFYWAAFGLGIAVLRLLDAPIMAARRLITAAFRLLAVVVAFAGLIFLLALPFTGLETLWATRQATAILLTMMILFVVLVNGAIDDGQGTNPFWKPFGLLVTVFLVVLPIYGLLALYAVWLRVDQYGLTPDRILALLLCVLVVIYSLVYAAAVIIKRRDWMKGLAIANAPLALSAIFAFIFIHIPGLDPVRLSIHTQLDRLESGKVDISEFDLGALKYQYGAPGEKALAKIRANQKVMNDPEAKVAFAQLDASTNLYDWRQAEHKTRQGLTGQKREKLLTSLDHVSLFPSNALMPERFLPALLEMSPDVAKTCANEDRCAMILLDFNRDGYDDTAIWSGSNILHLYIWNAPKDVYERPIQLTTPSALSLDILRQADIERNIRIVPARVDSLVIGDARFD